MTRRLLCVGEVVVDLVLRVPVLPGRGQDVLAGSTTAVAGGAVNVMTAARRQDVPVTYAGLLGTGPMGTLAAEALHAAGIEAPLPRRDGRDTATIVALVEPDGERAFVTSLGAEADLTGADLAAVAVRPDDVVYLSGYGLAYPSNGPALAGWVPTLPDTVTVVLDLGPMVAAIPTEVLLPVLARTDWLTSTVAEAAALVDDVELSPNAVAGGAAHADAAELANALRERVRRVAVVRDGERGASFATYAGLVAHVAEFPVSAVDRTGAGDAHTGCLVASLARHGRHGTDIDIVAAVRRANAAAALAVTRHGPATGPTTRELDEFLRLQA